MPIRDQSSDHTQREKRPQEQAIIGTISKYFGTAPSPKKPTKADMETSIINALRRYFSTKKSLPANHILDQSAPAAAKLTDNKICSQGPRLE